MRAATFILLAAAAVATAINPLVIKGSKWFDSVTGNQFYVVGVAYAPANAQNGDPLSDINGLNRDIPNFKDLGINSIRVYSADPSINHDQGMQLLADAGIYVMLDISSPEVGGSIDPKNPMWNTGTFGTYKSKIDAFLGYSNVLGFIAGNEVVNSYADTKAAAFVKASIRDSKAYIKSRGASIPVGYAATDIPANEGLQLYLDCISRDSSVDFYGINTYRWCGNNNFDQSYSYFENLFKNYDAPLLFTEYGCNDVTPRPFNDVGGIYSSRGAAFLSGGFVYEYTNEANNYGLVQINGNGLTKLQDYSNFKSAVAAINPPRTTLSTYTGNTNNVDTCPAVSNNFLSSSAALPPTPDSNTCGCLFNTLSCVIDTTDVTKIQGAVGYACSQISCADIDADSYNGVYGRYSGCSDVQKSSYVLSQYYAQNGPSQGSGACTFNGVAKVVTPTNSGCSAVTLPSAAPTRNTVFTAATSSTTSQNVQTSASAGQTSAAQTSAVAATSSAAVNPTSAVISEVTSATAAGTGVARQQGSTTSLIPMMLVVVAALVALF